MNIPTAITVFLTVLTLFLPVATYPGASLDEIRLKAEQGDATAEVQLGDAYDTAAGVKRDVAEAIKWYRKAAEQGNAEGQYSLGGKYDSGDGVPQDYSEALNWYRRAAEQGHSIAQYNLKGQKGSELLIDNRRACLTGCDGWPDRFVFSMRARAITS